MATGRDDGGSKAAPDATASLPTPEDDVDPPYELIEPDALSTCLVLSSPHSGDVYPARFVASARLDAMSLRRSEDAFVDRLFAGAVTLGMPLLRARFPRAYLDVNREPYELDPRMFEGKLPAFINSRSVRVAGGLGTIARVVGEAQEIYARRLTVEEGIGRIDRLYKPYHAALKSLVDRALGRFGRALLVDCHSMPSHQMAHQGGAPDERQRADVVIGDRYGTSCHGALTAAFEHRMRAFGYSVERNRPYAGGFITENYGRPGAGAHALQIEINRALYMDERAIRPTANFAAVAGHLSAALGDLAGVMDGLLDREAIAAE